MKAAVLENRGKIAIQEVERPKCGDGQVLVKVKSCGICRTDLKCYEKGQYDLQLPRILGHEIAGIIEEVGSGVDVYKKGDRIQVSPGITCGECEFCKEGMDNLCNELQIMGFNYDGGFAEYLLIPAQGVKNGILNFIPEETSFEEASMAEPLGCSINMQEMLDIKPQNTIVIFGGGRLGILNAKLAKLKKASKVILVEVNDKRLSIAKNYEFDHIIDSRKEDVIKTVLDITKGSGADIVIPCCPGYDAMNLGIHILAKKGKLGFFSGLVAEKGNNHLDFNLLHYKEITTYGAYGCAIKHTKEAVKLIANGNIQVKDMITKIISLDEVEQGIKKVKELEELSIFVNI